MSQAFWRHCCVQRRVDASGADVGLSIRYMDSADDFDIVAGDLAAAFTLLQHSGWQLVAVTGNHSVGRQRGLRLLAASVERYYFKRVEEGEQDEEAAGLRAGL